LSENMLNLPMLAAMGAAGMLHCAGMCGGLAVLAARGGWRFLLYTAGRTSSYLLLGTLAGTLGHVVVHAAPLGWGSRVLAIAGGVWLLLAGLESLGLVRGSLFGLAHVARWAGALAQLADAGAAGSLLLGAANGLLPCPMVYGFLALAAGTGSAVEGAAAMLVLALTSSIPLLFCAFFGRRVGAGRHAAGILMIAVAILTLYRGLSLAGLAGHHLH
jgi:sulfite exporter TauE/SafE